MFFTVRILGGVFSAVHLSLMFLIPQNVSFASPRDLCAGKQAGGYQGHLANSTFSF
jgi:hypothetical protein